MYATNYLPGPTNFKITILPQEFSFPSTPASISSYSPSDYSNMSDVEDSAAVNHSAAEGNDSGAVSESESATPGRFFTAAEKGFLVALEPAYHQYCDTLDGNGPRGLAGVKGDKADWIVQHAQNPLFKKFKRWRKGNRDLEKARKVRDWIFSCKTRD